MLSVPGIGTCAYARSSVSDFMHLDLILHNGIHWSKGRMNLVVSFTSRVIVSDDVLVRGIQSESILLNLTNERYYGLDEVGTHMWDVLESSSSVQEAFDRLLAEYDVDESTLRTDLTEFVSLLLEQGLIELHVSDLE